MAVSTAYNFQRGDAHGHTKLVPGSNREASFQSTRAESKSAVRVSWYGEREVERTLIIIDFHLWPLRHATVASISSMSPCRQFFPSTADIELSDVSAMLQAPFRFVSHAMLPAPKACTCAGSSTSTAMATSSRYFVGTPMTSEQLMRKSGGGDRKQEDGVSPRVELRYGSGSLALARRHQSSQPLW